MRKNWKNKIRGIKKRNEIELKAVGRVKQREKKVNTLISCFFLSFQVS